MRMNKHSRLHLPHPPARPGEAPDFSYVQLSPAGAVPRPTSTRARATLAPCRSIWCVCSTMPAKRWGLGIRISIPGLANRPAPHAVDAPVRRSHAANQRAGKISFYIRSLGEEAVSVAQCMALRPGDMLFRRIAIRACRSRAASR